MAHRTKGRDCGPGARAPEACVATERISKTPRLRPRRACCLKACVATERISFTPDGAGEQIVQNPPDLRA